MGTGTGEFSGRGSREERPLTEEAAVGKRRYKVSMLGDKRIVIRGGFSGRDSGLGDGDGGLGWMTMEIVVIVMMLKMHGGAIPKLFLRLYPSRH